MNRHVNPIHPDRKSTAPYNFVPLCESVFAAPAAKEERPPWKRYDEYIPGTYTGSIDLTIRTETPLYVRCAEDPNSVSHPDFSHFFHHGDPSCPVIPGSSIRGMIRSLVEIISFGKMQWFTREQLIYRAVGTRRHLDNSTETECWVRI